MKFILFADEKEKEASFFPLWQVIIFVVVVTLILIVLFPRYLLEKTFAYNQPSDITLSYLKAFNGRYPQNTQLIFALIEQEIGMGNLKEAQINLSYLKNIETSPSADVLNQFRWLDFLMLRFKTYKSKINTPERIAYLRQLRQMSKSVADIPLNPPQLRSLAMDNLALGQASIALKIYNHLFDRNELTTPEELAEGGSIAMQNNAQRDSAKFYMAAYNKATTLPEKKQYALNAIKALWAGNFVQEGLSIGNELPESVISDREILLYLTRLALAANRPDIAQKFAVKALLFKQK